MRVIVSPVIIDGRICRVVSAVAELLEVEEWAGAWWVPSSVPITSVSDAPHGDPEELRARGIPPEDCMVAEQQLTPEEIEARLRARSRDNVHAGQLMTETWIDQRTRQPKYAGNARFGRSARRSDGTHDRRGAAEAEWKGPWRRATDPPHLRAASQGTPVEPDARRATDTAP